jgi:hypothetical protein
LRRRERVTIPGETLMLKSKERGVLVPQFEHARLAGHLASLWGNQDFERPAFNFDSFVKGVQFHDRGFGLFDSRELGRMSTREHLQVLRVGVEASFDDLYADSVVKMHIRRLLDLTAGSKATALMAELESRLQAQLHRTNASKEDFEWADRITDFCDTLSLAFCSECYGIQHVNVYPNQGSWIPIRLNCVVDPTGIRVSPWPFCVPEIRGYLVAYEPEGYPDRREPVLLAYNVEWSPS